jgi:hypothetical protein
MIHVKLRGVESRDAITKFSHNCHKILTLRWSVCQYIYRNTSFFCIQYIYVAIKAPWAGVLRPPWGACKSIYQFEWGRSILLNNIRNDPLTYYTLFTSSVNVIHLFQAICLLIRDKFSKEAIQNAGKTEGKVRVIFHHFLWQSGNMALSLSSWEWNSGSKGTLDGTQPVLPYSHYDLSPF